MKYFSGILILLVVSLAACGQPPLANPAGIEPAAGTIPAGSPVSSDSPPTAKIPEKIGATPGPIPTGSPLPPYATKTPYDSAPEDGNLIQPAASASICFLAINRVSAMRPIGNYLSQPASIWRSMLPRPRKPAFCSSWSRPANGGSRITLTSSSPARYCPKSPMNTSITLNLRPTTSPPRPRSSRSRTAGRST